MPVRRMLCKILGTQGMQCFEAADGKQALSLLGQMKPDSFALILCDLMMPVMDGASFVAEARKLYDKAMPPVLVCSSRSDREAVQVVIKLGVAGYVLKPFKTDTVINKLREILPDLASKKE